MVRKFDSVVLTTGLPTPAPNFRMAKDAPGLIVFAHRNNRTNVKGGQPCR